MSQKICILGASGMLGHTLLYELSSRGYHVFGTVRDKSRFKGLFPIEITNKIIEGADAKNLISISTILQIIQPDIVINCIGIIRQLPEGNHPLPCIEINAAFPHHLLNICNEIGCRLIHYSTDCVFDGLKGEPYTEDDPSSAKDIYGMTKYLGELCNSSAITLRTSIIGHELNSSLSLVEWFLSQKEEVKGYTHALYSGLPAVEHARILAEFIIPRSGLSGLYHLSSTPISKYELLTLIAKIYKKNIVITPDEVKHEDKRLSSNKFFVNAGYQAPDWEKLIKNMYQSHIYYKEACK